ncbi:MAG TPA: STAS domain-containing protein [Candidatus Eisenbacteria bacterium]|nr:STAS domain-containing protein [Candidatus Eisenbacteria bacterium]
MIADAEAGRTSLSVNLQLTRGRHGAAARIELHERAAGRVALLALRGWIDLPAERGLERALDDLAERAPVQLVVDGSQLRHIDYRLVPRLVRALERFEAHAGAFVLCGLSRYLRDLFRLAGGGARLRFWPSAADLLAPPGAAAGAAGERTP